MAKLRIPRLLFMIVAVLLYDATPGGASRSVTKLAGWRGRRDVGEMTNESDEDGREIAQISVSTGTTGGVELAASDDDPPDQETFKENVEFDIKYQPNGRVTGTAKNDEQLEEGADTSGKRTRPKTKLRHSSRPHRTQFRRSVRDRHSATKKRRQVARRQTRRRQRNRARKNRQTLHRTARNKSARDRHIRRQTRRYEADDEDEDDDEDEEDEIRDERYEVEDEKKLRAENKRVRNTDRSRQTRRDKDKEEDEEEDEEEKRNKEEKDVEEDELSQMERYNEFLVKKDINDYFAQSKTGAEEEEEVFDRSERAGRPSVGRVKAMTDRRHNVTVHGGKKLGVIKSTATGIEVDIDGLGRGQGPVGLGQPNDVLPPWLRDQLPEADKMTLSDLNKLNEQVKHQDTMNRLDLFSRNPQADVKWKEPKMMSNCWIHAMKAPSYAFSPSCNPDGTYLAKQCYLERCWCVTRHGKPVVKNTVSRFYYKKAGIRLQCVEIPPHRGERPPALPTTPQPPRGSGPILGPPVNDEGPVVISKGAAAVANIPIHFQILD